MNVTVITHIGPLQTQIRESDTVESFLYELKEAVGQRLKLTSAPRWHYLVHKSRILSPDVLLSQILSAPGEELIYIHPMPTQASAALPKPQQSPKPVSVKPPRSGTSTPIPINVSQKRQSPHATVVKVGPSLPPASFFNADDLQGLEGMGFSSLRARQALLMFEGKFDPALDWLLGLANPADTESLLPEDQALFDLALAKYLQAHPE